jgi:hypothetical protein
MADEPTKKFDLPWGTLLPVLAAVAGLVAQYKPLVSSRPPVSPQKSVQVIAEQDVEARLWQDPIAVAQKQKILDDAQNAAQGTGNRSKSHEISALAGLLKKRVGRLTKPDDPDKRPAGTVDQRILLLAVMLEAGPYSELAEARLRARRAVLEGLSESGFVPRDGEHIGYVTEPWPPPEDKPPIGPVTATEPSTEQDKLPNDRTLLIPWEECEAVAKAKPKHLSPPDPRPNFRRIFLLWLPAVNFNRNPLSRFAALVEKLAPGDMRQTVEVKLLGPANSTGLLSMIREVRRSPEMRESEWEETTQKTLDGVTIVSPLATASDLTLLYQASPASSEKSASSVKELLERSVPHIPATPDTPGFRFIRTIATDEVVLRRVMEELERRRIPVFSQTAPNPRLLENLAHVVILSEWDTPYGRSLSTSFAALASGQSANEIIEQPPEKRPAWIHPYHYLRGIDGQLPGDPVKDNQRDSGQKSSSTQETVPVEATEGLNQSDYLRRLARQLKSDNVRWQREDGFGIRAIGLLGSDTYDKLMILRALRPQFRDVIFFTNNYDAHFERRDDWEDTRNLIIASPFGGALPETYSQQHVAPFRDSNQTSMYTGTLVATGKMDESVADNLTWQPRIFEIGRQGACDLTPPWYRVGKINAVSSQTWFLDWFLSGAVAWRVMIAVLALLATAAWIGVTIASRTLPGGGTTPQRLRRVLGSTIFWLACGGPVIVLAVAAFAQYGGAADEPLAFLSGISIWPTEMLRLIVVVLAVHFMIKAGSDLRANERKLTELYCFNPLPLTRFRWADLGVGLEQWRITRSKTSRPKAAFSAEEAWHAYLCRNKFWPRCIRIAILVTLYSAFSYCLLSLFPRSTPPARGETAFQFDMLVLRLSEISLMVLSFYVVDAIGLNSNFIRMFAREVTKWGRGVVRSSHRSPPLTEEELSAYHEIFFVAERTQVVARLIWYPLVALSLVFVARSSFFDNWTWPVSLVAIFALNAAWPIGSAVLLRRAAEQLREAALSNLQLLRIRGHAIAEKREMFDELIAEIRGLKKGAFAPLTEQPFVRAIIVPSGGLGLIALAQRFLDVF